MNKLIEEAALVKMAWGFGKEKSRKVAMIYFMGKEWQTDYKAGSYGLTGQYLRI